MVGRKISTSLLATEIAVCRTTMRNIYSAIGLSDERGSIPRVLVGNFIPAGAAASSVFDCYLCVGTIPGHEALAPAKRLFYLKQVGIRSIQ